LNLWCNAKIWCVHAGDKQTQQASAEKTYFYILNHILSRLERQQLLNSIINVSDDTFDLIALDVFKYQFTKNPLYRQYCQLINRTPDTIGTLKDIPFLPIQFFKTHTIQSDVWTSDLVFESSGTSGQNRSGHSVRSLEWYLSICDLCFRDTYGDPAGFCWLGLLPSYLERKNSSLVYMVDHFIRNSNFDESGFFLNDQANLKEVLVRVSVEKIPTILIGVSFALIDFAEKYQLDISNCIVMETGGMKGRREEMTRAHLHASLQASLGAKSIHSEYGMTELFSQSYSTGKGIFKESPTMKVAISDMTDPFSILGKGSRGTINIIDLANLDTCAFIATEDIGIKTTETTFEVLGRLDHSEMRGCNLMVQDLT